MATHRARLFDQCVLDACAEAGGQWVRTAVIRKRCSRLGWYPPDIDRALNDAIRLLADEGRIEIREPQMLARSPEDRDGQRYVRLRVGPVEPAPEPEAPTRTQMIADLIGRHPLTEAEAEHIRALLPPVRG